VEVQLRAFLTSTLNGDEWSASCPGMDRRLGGPQNTQQATCEY